MTSSSRGSIEANEPSALQDAVEDGGRQILDQFRGRGEKSFETVLDGAIADGHRQMGLTAPGLAVQDERTSFADKVGPQIGAEERLAKRRLEREIELVHGLEERKVGAPSQALQTRLLPSGHLFGEQESEEVTVRPAFLLGLSRDLLVDAARVRQVEALEQSIEFRLGESPALGAVVVRRETHRFTSQEEDFRPA